MNQPHFPYRIFPLGDTALTIDFGNVIDEAINQKVLALYQRICEQPLPGMIEAVPAYSSLTVYYNILAEDITVSDNQSVYDFMSIQLVSILDQVIPNEAVSSNVLRIPVCYEKEFAPDIEELSQKKGIPVSAIIQLHTARVYRVYMLGFLPGFPYMGAIDERIAVARKRRPAPVQAGSVGIAGRQTGVYPLASPGGWCIIGRTPMKFFDTEADAPVLLKPGDKAQFFSISQHEFENY